MNFLINLFKNKNLITQIKFKETHLGNMFNKFRILITYNILDLSLIKEIVEVIINLIKNNIDNKYNDVKNEFTNDELIISFRREIKRFYRSIYDELKNNYNLDKYYQILNMTIFLYILIITISIHDSNLFEILFEKNNSLIWYLKKLTSFVKGTNSQTELIRLISNLFSESEETEKGEFKNIIKYSIKSEELFYYNKSIFTYIIPDMNNFTLFSLNEITNSIYIKLLENIINIDFTYQNIFNNKNKETNFCLQEDKSLVKSMLCQAILRIVFSKEKNKFLFSENQKDIPVTQYEILFLKNLIKKCILFYYEKFGDNVNCLFRREEIYDDLIKYIFFTNGNFLFHKSCFSQLKVIIDNYQEDDKSNEILYLSKDEFIIFYEDLLKKLKQYTPNIIKIVLKLIYENVLEIYKEKISPENYSPVLTILFFNFLISPKIQEIYDVSPIKNGLVKNLNRIIRNICFNEIFKNDDTLFYFNEIIEVCHLHTKSAINYILNSFMVDDMDFILKCDIENNSVKMPNYLFYLDCDYVIDVLEISNAYNISDLSKEVDYIEKIMQNKRNSFCIKINLEDFKKLKILKNADEECNSEDEN